MFQIIPKNVHNIVERLRLSESEETIAEDKDVKVDVTGPVLEHEDLD